MGRDWNPFKQDYHFLTTLATRPNFSDVSGPLSIVERWMNFADYKQHCDVCIGQSGALQRLLKLLEHL